MNFFVHPLAWNRKNTAILRLIAISQNSLPLSLIDKLLFLLSKFENLNYCPDIWTNKSESRLKSRYIELTTLTQHIFPRICNMRKHKTQEWKGEKKTGFCVVSLVAVSFSLFVCRRWTRAFISSFSFSVRLFSLCALVVGLNQTNG